MNKLQEQQLNDFFNGTSSTTISTEIADKLCYDNQQLIIEHDDIDSESKELISKPKIIWNQTSKKKNSHGELVDKPMPTIENLEILMKSYRVFVDYDELLLKSNVRGIQALQGNEANTLISFMKNKCVENGLSKCVVDEQLDTISEKYVINPVVYWLKHAKRTTDNNPVKALVSLLPVDNKPWVEIALNRWLIQCCAAADMSRQSPHAGAIAKYESVLVFCGDQGTKKTSFIKYLLPKSLQAYTKEGILLDVKDKDSMLNVLRGWIPELGELDSTFKRSDISALKAFLSNTVDEIRLPYARKPIIITRHVSCFGTVNEEQYLRDLTGNRRYLPVKVIGSLDVMVKENFDIEDLWAYVWGEYKRGEQWWLTQEEEEIQKEALSHHEDTTIEDSLLDIFNFDTPKTKRMTGVEVLRAISQPNNQSIKTKVGIALKSLGVEKLRREYLMPRLRSMDDSFIDF